MTIPIVASGGGSWEWILNEKSDRKGDKEYNVNLSQSS
jgi:hypothetical protein